MADDPTQVYVQDDPTDVATAQEDVNAAGAKAATPGVGALGSNPQTDATNLSLAAAMERADYGNRFGFGGPGTQAPVNPNQVLDSAIEGRRAALTEGLANGVNPDKPAIYVDPKTRIEMTHELGTLTEMAHQNAQERAQNAHLQFIQDRNIQTANQVSAFFGGLQASKTQLGTPEHQAEVMGLAAKYPLALGTTEVREVLKTHAALHDTAASLTPPPGMEVDHVVQDSSGKSHAVFKPVSDVAATQPADHWATREAAEKDNPGATLQQTNEGWRVSGYKEGANPVASELFKAYKITPNQLLHPVKVEAGNGGSTSDFKNDNNGSVYKVDVGRKDHVYMPKAEFDRYKTALAPSAGDTSANQPASQFVPGKQYRDKNGNVATYQADGTWK